ncbi:MAG: PLP-dependent aspartate aminotransferase family protein [Acidobacteriota bacterium]
MSEHSHDLETRLVHAGERRIDGAVVGPTFPSSTYLIEGDAGYHDLRYLRLSNTPSQVEVADKIAALEGTESALVTSSGMSAISTALLTVLSPGDHLLVLDGPYGGTSTFVSNELARFGVEHSVIPGHDRDAWEAARRDSTRAIYVESITNPLTRVPDLLGMAAFAKEHGLVSLCDNTFATPLNFRPAEAGYDLVLHSATKYLNGHSDLVAGAICGRSELLADIKHRLDHLGGSLDPRACSLLNRGIKTLAVRLRAQEETASGLASYLDTRDDISAVHYPGLPGHPDHEHAQELLAGFSAMLSFQLADGPAADRFLGALGLILHAPSLGGVESLAVRPDTSAHAGLSEEEREASGIRPGLVRMSVGLESLEDLTKDIDRALAG